MKGKQKGNVLLVFLGIVIGVIGFIYLMYMLLMMIVNAILCSAAMGYAKYFEKCIQPQYKYDAVFEEEIPIMGEQMYKLRKDMADITYRNEEGVVVNPTDMALLEFVYNEGRPNESITTEYEGSIYIRALMTTDDYSLDGIDLTDEGIEERFGVTVEQLLSESTLGMQFNENVKELNKGFKTREELINALNPKAIEVGKKYDLFPSIILAQMIVESDGGNSELARNANNLLGIKADSNWKGEVYKKVSKETIDGVEKDVESNFKKFNSIEESIENYGYRTTETDYMIDRYSKIKRSNSKTYQESAKELGKVYATDPQYAEKILEAIKKYGLDKYDNLNAKESIESKPNLQDKTAQNTIKTESENENKATKVNTEKMKVLSNDEGANGNTSEPKLENPLKGKTIMLDPGHGGSKPGAMPYPEYAEKEFNIDVALSMKSKLEALGATVVLTRNSDVDISLGDRAKMAKDKNVDIFISIHANSSDDASSNGTETFYYNKEKDVELGTEIQKHMLAAWGLKDRGVKYKNLQVLRDLSDSEIPSVLIEPAFMINKEEYENYIRNQEQRDKLAIGLIGGVMSYYGVPLTEEMKAALGEIPSSVKGQDHGGDGVTDEHLQSMNRKHNNFLTVWMMARTMEKEYKKGDESDIKEVFDDIIGDRAFELKYDRRSWVMSVQTETYMCFFVGDKDGIFRSILNTVTGLEKFDRTPCDNLNKVYEKTFSEEIEYIPEQYQGVVGQSSKKEITIIKCNDGDENPKSSGEKCKDGSEPETEVSKELTLKYPEVGDVLGQFGLFTIYLNGVTVGSKEETYAEYLEGPVFRDIYDLDFEIKSISLLNGSSCYDDAVQPGDKEVSNEVKSYAEPIKKELAKYGLEDKMPILLGIMQQESGGKLSLDVMQSSESIGLKPNSITDPQYSIEVGVRHFKGVYEKGRTHNVDLQTIIQSYNFGGGYIDFIAKKGGKHTVALAKEFSMIQVNKNSSYNCGGNKSNFRYPYCYGDFSYTDKVLSFVSLEDAEGLSTASGGGTSSCSGDSDTPTFSGDGSALGEENFQKLLAAAKKYNGTVYKYGGTDPYKGIDCSAFMQVIFKEALGVNLPRTSILQWKSAKPISKTELSPGDLIFFKTTSAPVGHVGVYLGDGMMYHSGVSKGVSINPINDSYWGPKIVSYGRP